jgi:signal transduction histidine kinase
VVEELYTPEQLAQMHDSLWQCVLQFANFSARQERNRIARDLHDSLGHSLTGLNLQLQTAMKLCKPDPNQAQELLNEAHKLVTLATKEVRQSVKALRNDATETQSLEVLVASLAHDFQQTTGVLPEVDINLPMLSLPSHLITPIYRIIQEALNNIRKYAQATSVQIHVCTTLTGVYLIVKDNGRGFDPQNVSGGYGLQGMQERVAVLQGRLQLESQPGNGCCISVGIPMHISNKISEISAFVEADAIVQGNMHESIFLAQNQEISFLGIEMLPIPQSVSHLSGVFPSGNMAVKIGEWQPLELL